MSSRNRNKDCPCNRKEVKKSYRKKSSHHKSVHVEHHRSSHNRRNKREYSSDLSVDYSSSDYSLTSRRPCSKSLCSNGCFNGYNNCRYYVARRPCSSSLCNTGCCNGFSNCKYFVPSYMSNCYNPCGYTNSGSYLLVRQDCCDPCRPVCSYETCFSSCGNGYSNCTFIKKYSRACCYELCCNGCCNGYSTCSFYRGSCNPCGTSYRACCYELCCNGCCNGYSTCVFFKGYGYGGCNPCYDPYAYNCKRDDCYPKKYDYCKVSANLSIISVNPPIGIPGETTVYNYSLNLTNTGCDNLKGTLMISTIGSATSSSFNIGNLAPGSVQQIQFVTSSTSGNPPALQAYISTCGKSIGIVVTPLPPANP